MAALNNLIKQAEEEFPNVATPQEFAAARVTGTNGWPAIEEIGREYGDLSYEASWTQLTYTLSESWPEEVQNYEQVMENAFADTYPFTVALDKALEANCLVPPWNDEPSVIAGLEALNLLVLRVDIAIYRKSYDSARADARRALELAFRFDASWSTLGCMMMSGYRRAAYQMILALTQADLGSRELIAEALNFKGARVVPFKELALFEQGYLIHAIRQNIPATREEWIVLREEQAEEGFTLEKWATVQTEMLNLWLEVVRLATQRNWRLTEMADARQYLRHVQKLSDELTPFESGFINHRSMEQAVYNQVKNCLQMHLIPVALKWRQLDFDGKLPPVPELQADAGLPEGITVREVDGQIQFVANEQHPLTENQWWSDEDYILALPPVQR